jgi:hypothetical protein
MKESGSSHAAYTVQLYESYRMIIYAGQVGGMAASGSGELRMCVYIYKTICL